MVLVREILLNMFGIIVISRVHCSTVLVTGHTDSIEAVRMSSSMPYSATGSVDGNLIIWDNTSLSVRSTCAHPEVNPDSPHRKLVPWL